MAIDFATIIGLILGFTLLLLAVSFGGDIASFVDIPSVLIVLGGTASITLVCFSGKEVARTFKNLTKAFVFRAPDEQAEARLMLELAQRARSAGILSVQKDIETLSDPFLRQGFQLAIDGVNPEAIETVMRGDTESMLDRHQKSIAVLRKAAEVAPAMGLIGTVIGLVQMLANLSDPDRIGPAMALALITTLYGAVLSYLVFMPLAAKLERNSLVEYQLRRIYTVAVLSVVRQENPRQLEVMINAILPPAKRVQVFD